MKIQNYILSAVIAVAFMQGCSAPYFGYTKMEWDKLTEEEKTIIKGEYQMVIDSKNNQAHIDKIDDRTQSIIDHGVTHPGH